MPWRSLSVPEKFAYLANHFVSPEEFAWGARVPLKTSRRLYSLLNEPEPSKGDLIEIDALLSSGRVHDGLARARRVMRDDLARVDRAASKARYVTPIIRTPITHIEPFQYSVKHQERDRTRIATSHWVGFRVEHLPEDEIFSIIRARYELYLQTGQFNAFRYEYLALADWYLDDDVNPTKRIDASLHRQALTQSNILLSSWPFRFPEAEGNPDVFEKQIRRDWAKKKLKGAIAIVNIFFTKYTDVENVMGEVRSDYKAWKRSNKRGNKKGPKRGAR